MLGAIAGDIIGSAYERNNIKTKDFDLFSEASRFTDDTVCTVAVAKWLMEGGDLSDTLADLALRYKSRGFGSNFMHWAQQWERHPYNSWGNGSAMRVSPVSYWAKGEDDLLDLAKKTAEVTHNHPDGIAGAQATALAIWLARHGEGPSAIREEIEQRFKYDLSRTVDEIRPGYSFDISCPGSVPQAITCALEATDFEDAIRNAVSIGGDSDTIACIAGGIAEARFGIPDKISKRVEIILNPDFNSIIFAFDKRLRHKFE